MRRHLNIDQFINELVGGNETAAEQLQEFAGYCLLGDCRFRKALVLNGTGLGKSTYAEILRLHVAGLNRTLNLRIKDFNNKFEANRLSYALLNAISGAFDEIYNPPYLAKMLICGDSIVAARKHKHDSVVIPFCKHILITNEIIPEHINRVTYRIITVTCLNQPTKIIPHLAVDMDPRQVADWAQSGLLRLLINGRFSDI
ncbi:MAG: hypothetical protein JW715_12700 [Sedimentisphaerales bacterium]|nr:hypothetical protein [Sedimentisphaerales bacterium]